MVFFNLNKSVGLVGGGGGEARANTDMSPELGLRLMLSLRDKWIW